MARSEILPNNISLMLVWYGLYFGVLRRDCAKVAADRMVSRQHSPLVMLLRDGVMFLILSSGFRENQKQAWENLAYREAMQQTKPFLV